MGMVFVTAGACEKLDCDCCRLDSKRIEEGDPVPPLHDGCTCYLVSEEAYERRLTKEQETRFVELLVKSKSLLRKKVRTRRLLRERGAVRVEVPVERTGSIRVDFAIDRSGRVQRKCQNPDCGKLTELLLYDIADAPEKWSCAHCGAWNEPGLVVRKPTLEPEDPGDKEAERQRKE